MRRHELVPNLGGPGEGYAVDERNGRRRIVVATERLGDPIDVAGIDEADDHLLALRRDPHDLQAPVKQHEEGNLAISPCWNTGVPFGTRCDVARAITSSSSASSMALNSGSARIRLRSRLGISAGRPCVN